MPDARPSQESEEEWIDRCMSDDEAMDDFPDQDQRLAFCNSKWEEAVEKSDDQGESMLETIKKFFGNDDAESIGENIKRIEKLHNAGGLGSMSPDDLVFEFTKLSRKFSQILDAGRALVVQMNERRIDLPDTRLRKALNVFSGGKMAKSDLAKASTPSWSGKNDSAPGDWSEPTFAELKRLHDIDQDKQWDDLTSSEESDIKGHYLDPSSESFSANRYPVVDANGDLHRGGLITAKRFAARTSADDDIEQKADKLLRDEFDHDTEETQKSVAILKGQGADDPKVAFVGANPSRLDMVRKKHMSGPVGRTLNEKYLEPAGLDESEVYKTAVVPTFLSDEDGPRQPTSSEIKKHAPSVIDELQEVEPDFVVALGKKAREALGDVADEFVPHPRAINIHGDSGEAGRKMSRLGRKIQDGQVGKKAYKESEKVRDAEIVKADDERQIVYGIAYEPGVEDSDGNWADEDAIEKAAHRYLSYFQNADHEHLKSIDAWPVESYIAKTDFKLGGEDVRKGSWVVAIKVNDDEAWKRVKSGEYRGFSIGAMAEIDPDNRLN